MAASDHLNPLQFKFFASTHRSMGGVPHHTVEAWKPEEASSEWANAHPAERNHYAGSAVDPGTRPVGSMSWLHTTGEIRGISVDKPNQRQGIGTSLWQEAHRVAGETRGVKPPRHSAQRTDSGEAWARSLGGRLPRRQR